MSNLKIHFLGIGGSGASAAAAIAQAQSLPVGWQGYEITGCDNDPSSEFLKPFKQDQLFKGHHPTHLTSHSSSGKPSNIDMLVVTPAIFSLDPYNPELQTAKENNIPILTWQQFVGEYLMKDKFVVAVAGTHGKSTTTAMISLFLENAGLDPTVILGAIVPKWGTNYRINTSHSIRQLADVPESYGQHKKTLNQVQGDNKKELFIIEADEFNDNFLSYTPDISIVTNIEMDHPEYFKDFETVKASFKAFLNKTRQTIIVNLSDANIASLLHGSIVNNETIQQWDNIKIIDYSKNLINFQLKVPGEHNILNASAAYQVGMALNIDPEVIKNSLANFTGAARRFEKIGEYMDAQIYSDFGHHPTEIKVTMEAARKKFPDKRILLIFQPHMFSRTKALFDDFIKVFKELPVDKIIITDIYPSREIDTGLVTSKQLADAVGYRSLIYQTIKDLDKSLKDQIQKEDIVFFMGAGDIDKLARQLV